MSEEQEKSGGKGSVTHPGNHESLAGRIAVFGHLVPETDQEVAAKPYPLPPQIEQQKIVSQHQCQHGADKKVHICEKAAVAFLLLHHEFGGVQMNEKRDEGDDYDHQQRECVDVECNARVESGHIEPYPDGLRVTVCRRLSAQKRDG